MALSESDKLGIRLDALIWRLEEAREDLAVVQREVKAVEQQVVDHRFARLFEEVGPPTEPDLTAAAERSRLRLASEQSLVERLQQRCSETRESYERAIRRERVGLLLRMLHIKIVEEPSG
jgi:hypothetical protein